ncbi:hypothetical protein [Tabrizicola sp.]|uniref:hypothetical protein n=1 Tax=Tabrizicola sp. TaxID=2005166 RepID=UPI00286B9402|nr:hypothetical protein [Tabrizicola sp.]
MTTNTKTLKENLQDGADATLKAAAHVADVANGTMRHLASDAAAQAADTAAALRDSAVERLDDARDALSESGDRLAETLRRAAEEPVTGSMQARVLSAVAGGVSSAAHTLHDRSVSEMAADLRALARRHPGAFAAGAAVAGFALARFLRASAGSHKNGHGS